MIAAMIPHAAQSQLRGYVDVTLLIFAASMFVNLFGGVIILHPNGTAVYAFNRPRFALSPLIKAGFMDIVAASSFTPQNLLARLEFYYTHWTVTLDRFSLSGMRCVFGAIGGLGRNWGMFEYLFEFCRKQSLLVLKMLWSFQNVDENLSTY